MLKTKRSWKPEEAWGTKHSLRGEPERMPQRSAQSKPEENLRKFWGKVAEKLRKTLKVFLKCRKA